MPRSPGNPGRAGPGEQCGALLGSTKERGLLPARPTCSLAVSASHPRGEAGLGLPGACCRGGGVAGWGWRRLLVPGTVCAPVGGQRSGQTLCARSRPSPKPAAPWKWLGDVGKEGGTLPSAGITALAAAGGAGSRAGLGADSSGAGRGALMQLGCAGVCGTPCFVLHRLARSPACTTVGW